MTQNIRSIFERNIRLLGNMDKAILYFREQQCDKALSLIADSMDEVNYIIEAIITDRDYFNLVNTESIFEMLNGILEAKKNTDFILLADLLELQMMNFLLSVQELIIGKEEIVFDEERYKRNISCVIEKAEGNVEQLQEPMNPTKLLESGYRIEFTSSGLMTLAAENEGSKFYFHTNNKIQTEAFCLAGSWLQKEADCYILYGLGMGYHIKELLTLAPNQKIEIYESDANVIRLACAFTDLNPLLSEERVRLIYDPDFELLSERINKQKRNEIFRVHYPSFKNIHGQKGKAIVETGLPWLKVLEINESH